MSRGKRGFSVEFKQAVVQEVLAGESQVKVARKHGISVNTVGLWIKSYKTGSLGGEGTGDLQLTRLLTENRELLDRIEEILSDHQCYGYRPVMYELRRRGVIVNHKVVQRLMKQSGLSRKAQKQFIATTDSRHNHFVYPNLYQNQRAFAPNQIWLADITYIQLRDHPIFLAAILDAYSRRAIGWALSRSLSATFVVEALKQALKHRTPLPGCIHHSDRGVQYACGEYTALLK